MKLTGGVLGGGGVLGSGGVLAGGGVLAVKVQSKCGFKKDTIKAPNHTESDFT